MKKTKKKATKYALEHIHKSNFSEDHIVKELKHIGETSDLNVRMPSAVLGKILREGEFKNQHETGKSKGTYNPESRKKAERNAFGEDLENPKDFPIYGYLDTSKYSPGGGDFTQHYGNTIVKLKDNVKDRSTMTVGDSIRGFTKETLIGTPIKNPNVEGFDNGKLNKNNRIRPMDYIEAQVHGRVGVNDIESVTFMKPPPKSTAKLLDKHKISFTVK